MNVKIICGAVFIAFVGSCMTAVAVEQAEMVENDTTAVSTPSPAVPIKTLSTPNTTSNTTTAQDPGLEPAQDMTSPADTSETQDSVPAKPATQNDLNPGLTPDDVEEVNIDQLINETSPAPISEGQLPSGIDRNAGFSAYDYLMQLKSCQAGVISAGADAVSIEGYKSGRCHVIFSIAGRKVDCMLTHSQVSQMTTPEKLKQAKAFDRGVGIMLRPLGSDDPDSPLANCVQ